MISTRRKFLSGLGATGLLVPASSRLFAMAKQSRDYNATKFGARGDGTTNDTAAIQAAIDAASAAGGGRVVVPGGKRYRVGSLVLKDRVDLHLAEDSVLVASVDPDDYLSQGGIIMADGVRGARLTGTGHIDGQGKQFMTTYSETDERWEPKKFRPFMFSLKRCNDLEITGISFGGAPNWGLHMLGCDHVLVDGVRIRNFMDVPNCDGIDPDHCRDVEIRNCDIVCADDAIVIKTSEQSEDYGPSHDIVVKDCTVTSRDSGLKIGTETFADISRVRFERCKVVSGGRGPTITHRQPGNIEDIEFRDIEVSAEHHAARWWGWGEAASITAWPRVEGIRVGALKNIKLRNIKARSENSFRIDGQVDQPIQDVLIENVSVTIDRWTKYPGEHFDNRPTPPAQVGLEPHMTPAFSIRNAKNVSLKDCTAQWGSHKQPYFAQALEIVHVDGLHVHHFQGVSAAPDRVPTVTVDGRPGTLNDLGHVAS